MFRYIIPIELTVNRVMLFLRIRYDKDTCQSKGFAFCEFADAESCVLAVKHLHGTLIGGMSPLEAQFKPYS